MMYLLIILFTTINYAKDIEKLTYEVFMKNLKAGTAELTLSEDAKGNHYILNFELRSYKYLDAIYKLRENTSMIMDRKDFFIYEINKYVRQGRKKRHYNGMFNYDTGIAHINNKILTFEHPVYDPINIIYYIRKNLNLFKDQFIFSIISKNSFKNINMQIIEEETIILDNKKYNCIVVGHQNKQKNLDDIKIWLSKDSLALPVMIEKRAKLGVIKMELTNIKNYE